MTAEIIIIGGGASGLMAAIAAGTIFSGTDSAPGGQSLRPAAGGSAPGAYMPVLLFERMDKTGKKILATGNGRCNFSNTYMDQSCFRSDSPKLAENVLEQFGQEQATELFQTLGIMVKNRDGYLYPLSGQASSILDVLMCELARLPVKVVTDSKVLKIMRVKDKYQVTDGRGQVHTAKKVIIACGGRAYPKLGSDGSGYKFAKALGHTVIRPVPALTALYTRQDFFKKVAGVRADGCIRLYITQDSKPAGDPPVPIAWDRGELQLTDYGISGIPVFQVSRFAAKALAQKLHVKAVLDFMPDMDEGRLFMYLWDRAVSRPQKTAEEFLIGMFNKKLCDLFISLAQLPPGQKAGSLSKKQLGSLVRMIKALETDIVKTGDFDHAQVCAGGVDGRELDRHLQSLKCPGLYFSGEIIDVDGICGGYNLQWAWSSGYVSGQHAALSVLKEN